jgi:ankyrin repeat protein
MKSSMCRSRECAAVQLACVKFLVEQRKVEVNQRDLRKGWTPLLRCANMAHHTHAPYLEIFEYLLQQGADASLLSDPDPQTGRQLSAVDIAVQQASSSAAQQLYDCQSAQQMACDSDVE